MRASVREDILKAGLEVMFKFGYVGSTVRDICDAAGAPTGSFTNHFGSKEVFAKEVLDRYFETLQGRVANALNDTSLSPRQRLNSYFEMMTGILAKDKFGRGCLIGDFSIETATQSELLRERLQSIFNEWRQPFMACIQDAQELGEIDSTFSPHDLAEFLLASWEGAILRMKVERNSSALDRFREIAFKTVFKQA
jgi:TetR/AcrR family transcriptional repressor of nem operon